MELTLGLIIVSSKTRYPTRSRLLVWGVRDDTERLLAFPGSTGGGSGFVVVLRCGTETIFFVV